MVVTAAMVVSAITPIGVESETAVEVNGSIVVVGVVDNVAITTASTADEIAIMVAGTLV